MRKYVSSTPLVKTLLSDFRQLYFEKVGVRSLASLARSHAHTHTHPRFGTSWHWKRHLVANHSKQDHDTAVHRVGNACIRAIMKGYLVLLHPPRVYFSLSLSLSVCVFFKQCCCAFLWEISFFRFLQRLALLRPAVRAHLEAMSKQRGLTAMIRYNRVSSISWSWRACAQFLVKTT